MLAGGCGMIREEHVEKGTIPVGAPIVVLGGPAMLIGLGGGAASSMSSGASAEDLDFASVQRGNPEMERRVQEVIDACWALGEANPIMSIHDVGAGGLSNAVPELVNDSGRGGRFELRAIPNDDPGMSPMQVWCNESQERYVLAVDEARMEEFEALCERERCPYAVLGEATEEQQLVLGDGYFDNTPIDLPMSLLLGKPPKMLREVQRLPGARSEFSHCGREYPRRGVSRAAPAGCGGQDLPDHHRRPFGHRHGDARPDGRTLAGAGGRRGGDRLGLRELYR